MDTAWYWVVTVPKLYTERDFQEIPPLVVFATYELEPAIMAVVLFP